MTAERVTRRRFDWRYIRVGALAAFALAILIVGVYQVGKIFDVFAERYTLVSPAPSAYGLREGAPVTLAGQRVGQVAAIELIPLRAATDSNHVWLHLSVAREVQEQIRTDSRAHIRSQGLLGDKFVDIVPGTEGAAVLQPGDTLPAAPTVDLDRVLALAAETLDTARTLVSGLTRVTEPLARGEGTLGALLYDDALYLRLVEASSRLALTLEGLNEGRGTLGRLARDPTLYDNLNTAVLRLDEVSEELLRGQGTLGRLVRSDSLYQALVSTAANADSAVGALSATLQGISEGQGTLGRLAADPSLYEAVLKAVVDLQAVIDAIRQDPSRIRPEVKVDIF